MPRRAAYARPLRNGLRWRHEGRAGALRRPQGLHGLRIQSRGRALPRSTAHALGRGRDPGAPAQCGLGERLSHAEGPEDRGDAQGHHRPHDLRPPGAGARGGRDRARLGSRRAVRAEGGARPAGRARSSESVSAGTSWRSSASSGSSRPRGSSPPSASAASRACPARSASSPAQTRPRAAISSRRSAGAFRRPRQSSARPECRGEARRRASSPACGRWPSIRRSTSSC